MMRIWNRKKTEMPEIWTKHYIERMNGERGKAIKKVENIDGVGELVNSFTVEIAGRVSCDGKADRQIHNIWSNGIIKIYDAKDNKHITDLVAVPFEIERYYDATNKKAPKDIVAKARKHQKMSLDHRC